ncbi:MAG: DUF29 domain-containing protein [Pseudanabaena sp. Salubria-1]|nr:DUF29 domain-containing protein [Pseudanabaena sp. Salubria-1]
MMIAISPKATLYERDFNLWLEDTIAKLKAGDFQNIDIENLIEEIAGVTGSDKREIENRLQRLIEHILKRCYVSMPDCYRGWQVTIVNQRQKLVRLLRQSPSLKCHFLESFDEVFDDALKIVQIEYDVEFPDTWQFSRDIDSILNVDFWE